MAEAEAETDKSKKKYKSTPYTNFNTSKKMKNHKMKLEDFEADKLTKNQQKTVRGGDGEDPDPTDPGKGGHGGGAGGNG